MRLLAAAALLLTSAVQATTQNTTDTASTGRVLSNGFVPPRAFKNVNLLRNINLEKGYVRETINVVVENVDSQAQSQYYLPFQPDVFNKVGGVEAWEKDATQKQKFHVEKTQSRPDHGLQFFIINLPKPLAPSSKITLSISYYLLSSLAPLPATIEQSQKQYLTYSFSAYALSSYITDSQKTKIKFPGTDVPDYTKTSGLKDGADPEKQGSTFTYGPYKSSDVKLGTYEPITVRYEFTKPVIACSLLERDIEVSHWGGNIATEDRFWLRNDAANLSKQFSRVAWAMKTYQGLSSSALAGLRIPLKPGAVDPYFTDDIGNVSTSIFRPGAGNRGALWDLRPRYPVFGGWKYSFKIGWNDALSSFLRKPATSGESYVLKVPFLEGPRMPEGVQYEKMEFRVILPEGAQNVRFEFADGSGMPNNVQSEIGLHKTFMDTIGRTVLKLTATNVADEARDGQLLVSYDYPFTALLRKPLTIFVGALSIFVAAWVVGNLDVSIKRR